MPLMIFDLSYICENVTNSLHQKVAQNVAISLGYYNFSIGHNFGIQK